MKIITFSFWFAADPSSEFFRLRFRLANNAVTSVVFINLHSCLPIGIGRVFETTDSGGNEEVKDPELYSQRPSSWNISLEVNKIHACKSYVSI